METNLIEKAEKYVKEMFNEKYDARSVYHSYDHTLEVSEAARKIGKESGLDEEDREVLIVAALFHDIGYLFQQKDHESQSIQVASEFLKANSYPDAKMKKVADCIRATQINHIPGNLMEEVIHDADFINLSKRDNLFQSELLKEETANYGGTMPTEEEWLMAELKFLLDHRYYTTYARKKFNEKKEDNIKRVKKQLKKYREHEALLNHKPVPLESGKVRGGVESQEDRSEDKKTIDKKEVVTIKGFESIYRLISTNHMRMNAIADRKANIMLTLNGIIVSIALSIVAADSESHRRLMIPISILIIVCLVTIIFATLSTRPKITPGTIAKEDIEDKKANLLFFGNFARMPLKDFDYGLRKIMEDQEYLHNAMILDFYSLGQVLDMKFRYLRICYNVFMYGIILAVISLGALIAMGY